VLDSKLIDATRIYGPRQLTDVFLLSLAVRHGGRFVTFDQSVPVQAVKSARARDLVVL
jgi:uncharacterized protein